MLEILAFLVLYLSLVWLWRKFASDRTKQFSDQFPEPSRIWGIGLLPFIAANPGKPLLKWKQKLGPVYKLNIVGKQILVLNDVESIAECFGKDEFTGRVSTNGGLPLMELLKERCGAGIGFHEGPHVREQRHFFLRAFREYGLQKNKMEENIHAEMRLLIENWTLEKCKPFSAGHAFTPYTLNMVWRLLGCTSMDEEQTEVMLNKMESFAELSLGGKLALVFPKIMRAVNGIVDRKLNDMECVTNMVRDQAGKTIDSRISHEPRNVIDKYMDIVEDTKDESSSFHESQKSLVPALRDILGGGTETSATTLLWFVLLMLHNPKAARKLQKEIDTVVGADRLPSLEDKANMPYADACVLEVLRWATIITLVPRSAMVDTEFRGKFVPKGALVLANLWGVHHDPAVWEAPQEFNPDRFIKDGVINKELAAKVMPFGSGKRVCLAFGFILKQLFLTTTCIYQNFNISHAGKLPSLDGCTGFEYRPYDDVRVVATPRMVEAVPVP